MEKKLQIITVGEGHVFDEEWAFLHNYLEGWDTRSFVVDDAENFWPADEFFMMHDLSWIKVDTEELDD